MLELSERNPGEPLPESPQSPGKARLPYEAPLLTKKRSLERVTLFSGAGPTGSSALNTML